jgi:hypothetical protein
MATGNKKETETMATTINETVGRYSVGSKVWLLKPNGLYYRVTIIDNVIKCRNCYRGYKVKAYSESCGEYYTIGAVGEDDLTFKKPVNRKEKRK